MKTMKMYMMTVLLLATGMVVGCSNEDSDEDLISSMAYLEPEFTYKDFDAVTQAQEIEEITNGTWLITKVNGLIHLIIFYSEGTDSIPLPASPKTTEDFFKEFLPLTADNQMMFVENDYRGDPHYKQYYKGVPVEEGWWHISFLDGIMQSSYGKFIPIEELDANPSINMATAKKIVENYIKDIVDGEDKNFYLTIMSFPENGKWKPRLVYVYKHQKWEEGELVYVDAQTGRLLYHSKYIGGGGPY